MELKVIDCGKFNLDGGAMFGVVPKTMWEKTNPANEKNLIDLTARCLLVIHENRKILIDTGLGDKQSSKFFGYYNYEDQNKLTDSLASHGLQTEDITDVFLTHLHFDHCGGAVIEKEGNLEIRFPKATYWSSKEHWDWATNPNPREKASFLKENILPIEKSGQLKFADINHDLPFEIIFIHGHTRSQMLPVIKYKDKTLVFAADLIPTASHIPIPYIMSYDVEPLKSMDEKIAFLNKAVKEDFILFLEHDATHECCTLINTEKGIRLNKTLKLNEI